MRKITLIITAFLILFTGCAEMSVGNNVERYYQKGIVVNSRKCIVNDRMTAVVTGVGVGAVAGAVAGINKHTTKKALIGGVIGGVIGGLMGKEVTAYKLTILSNNREYIAFSKVNIPLNSLVEFTVVNNKVKNLNIIRR